MLSGMWAEFSKYEKKFSTRCEQIVIGGFDVSVYVVNAEHSRSEDASGMGTNSR